MSTSDALIDRKLIVLGLQYRLVPIIPSFSIPPFSLYSLIIPNIILTLFFIKKNLCGEQIQSQRMLYCNISDISR